MHNQQGWKGQSHTSCLCFTALRIFSSSPVVVWQHNMDSRAGLANLLGVLVAQTSDPIRVGTCGIDHTLCLDVPFFACKPVSDVSSSHALPSIVVRCFQQTEHFGVVGTWGAIPHSSDCQCHVHPSIIMLTCLATTKEWNQFTSNILCEGKPDLPSGFLLLLCW